MSSQTEEGVPIYDNLDIDLIIKVLNHTLFSPFFIFFVPIFFVFQGAKVTDPKIIGLTLYFFGLCLFWFIRWYSKLYRNQGSLLFGPPRFDWGEQIVLITGGASGIGELLANTLAVRNVTVVVLDVNPIVTENYNITYYKCDVSKWEEVAAVAERVREEVGDPTVIINNAGVVQGKLILDLSEKDVLQTFGVNTLAHFWTLKAFLPAIVERGEGHIITMSSVMGITASAQMTDYCASKAAVIALNQALRSELDHRYKTPKVRTSVICPGHVHTKMFQTVKFPESFLWRFFFPSLHPIDVVKQIIAVLDDQHSTEVYLPFYTNFAPLMGLLPSFIRDFAQWIATADYAMQNFVKVSGRRPSEGPCPSLVKSEKDD